MKAGNAALEGYCTQGIQVWKGPFKEGLADGTWPCWGMFAVRTPFGQITSTLPKRAVVSIAIKTEDFQQRR